MKTSNPRKFPTSGKPKKVGKNSGIFSNSGAGQKKDKVKPSMGSKPDMGVLDKAVTVPQKKSISGSGNKVGSKKGLYIGMGRKAKSKMTQPI